MESNDASQLPSVPESAGALPRQVRAIPFSPIRLFECTVLGGFGYDLVPAANCTVAFESEMAIVSTRAAAALIPYQQITHIDIAGPGTVVSGGGFIGGYAVPSVFRTSVAPRS